MQITANILFIFINYLVMHIHRERYVVPRGGTLEYPVLILKSTRRRYGHDKSFVYKPPVH